MSVYVCVFACHMCVGVKVACVVCILCVCVVGGGGGGNACIPKSINSEQ